MNERVLKNSRQEHRQRDHISTLQAIGSAGTILLLGAGAAYFLAVASTEALATTATVLVTVGLFGLLVLGCVCAARWSLPGRDSGGGPDGGWLEPVPIRPDSESDATRFRVLDGGRIGDHYLGGRTLPGDWQRTA